MMPACAVAHALPVTDVYATAHEHFDYLIAQLHSPEVHVRTHSELEALLEVEGRELLRRLVQAHLDERSPGTVAAPVLDADGHPCSPQRCHTRHLMTLFGEVEVVRMGYGGRSTPSLHPLDAALNLPPERYSHRVRQRVAVEAAKNSFDDVVATLTTTSGAHVPKRQTEQLGVRAGPEFRGVYSTQRCATAEAVQDTSAVLVLSVDSKGVPMRTADLRAATQRAAAHPPPRGSRRPQGERGHTKRMATVATVYTIAPWVRTPADILRELQSAPLAATACPRPEAKRVWASVAQPMADVIRQAFEEARRRDPQHTKQWVALVDGNPTQLGLLSEMATEYNVELRIELDLIHVLEYVWKAAKAFHPLAPLEAETWVTARLEELLLWTQPPGGRKPPTPCDRAAPDGDTACSGGAV